MGDRVADLLRAAEEAARLHDFIDVMAGEPTAATAPPVATARAIEEHLLVGLAARDPAPIAEAVVLLRRLIARLERGYPVGGGAGAPPP